MLCSFNVSKRLIHSVTLIKKKFFSHHTRAFVQSLRRDALYLFVLASSINMILLHQSVIVDDARQHLCFTIGTDKFIAKIKFESVFPYTAVEKMCSASDFSTFLNILNKFRFE